MRRELIVASKLQFLIPLSVSAIPLVLVRKDDHSFQPFPYLL